MKKEVTGKSQISGYKHYIYIYINNWCLFWQLKKRNPTFVTEFVIKIKYFELKKITKDFDNQVTCFDNFGNKFGNGDISR